MASRDNSKLLVLGALAATALGVWYYISSDDTDGGGEDDDGVSDEPVVAKRKLLNVWTMLVKNMELHKFQIQQILHQQITALAQRGAEIPKEQITATYKQNFEESLENVQSQILQHFGVSEEDFEEATDYYKDNAEIATLVTELENLYMGDAKDADGPLVDISIEQLESILSQKFGKAWCDAFAEVHKAFQDEDKDFNEDQQLLLEFHSRSTEIAQDNLAKALETDGLTPTDFQKLLLQYQSEPRINAALQVAQLQQQEFLQQKIGMRI